MSTFATLGMVALLAGGAGSSWAGSWPRDFDVAFPERAPPAVVALR